MLSLVDVPSAWERHAPKQVGERACRLFLQALSHLWQWADNFETRRMEPKEGGVGVKMRRTNSEPE